MITDQNSRCVSFLSRSANFFSNIVPRYTSATRSVKRLSFTSRDFFVVTLSTINNGGHVSHTPITMQHDTFCMLHCCSAPGQTYRLFFLRQSFFQRIDNQNWLVFIRPPFSPSQFKFLNSLGQEPLQVLSTATIDERLLTLLIFTPFYTHFFLNLIIQFNLSLFLLTLSCYLLPRSESVKFMWIQWILLIQI